ncbi:MULTISPECIES: hypothetical protein [Jannaschia]|uniref:hypothetical protein n=1 Tax=Jannaschia TaxID=188905 RepID=UPI001C7D9FBD|nr:MULTISPECIES: hypothetical protein [unclassified Jannaschia]
MTKTLPPAHMVVVNGLMLGWGVDDISVRSGIPVDQCRIIVGVLRDTGRLAEIYSARRPAS